MRADFTGTPGTDWQLTGGTYHFSGPPGDCTGELSLLNLSSGRMRIRRLETIQPARTRKGFKALPATKVRLRTNLAPNSNNRVYARLELPEHMPPGRYQARLQAGEEKAALEIEVDATSVLETDPEDLELQARAGQAVSFRITLRNGGNLPLDILQIAPVWLTEEDWTERLLVSALQETNDTEDFGALARRLLAMARDDIPSPAQLRVEPEPGFTLDPGQTLKLAMSLTLPDNLKTGREYRGFIRINGERIGLEVYCSGDPVDRGTPQPAAHES